MLTTLRYDKARVEEAKDLRKRWYRGEKVERAPYFYSVPAEVTKAWFNANSKHDFADICNAADKAIEAQLMSMQHQCDTFPDCDFIPAFAMFYMGEGILAAMFGAEQLVVPDAPPFTKGRVLNSIDELVKLKRKPDIENSEWGLKLKEHMLRMVDATHGEIPIASVDYQSPYGTATKIMDNEELMLAMYDEPELVTEFLNIVTNGIIDLIETMKTWVGEDLLCLNNSNPIPGASGIVIWDDYISVINPKLHEKFCSPCNLRLYEKYGKGHLHTCGPYFPSYIDACLACRPVSMDTSIMRGMGKTREDLLAFRAITREHGIKLFGGLLTNEGSIFNQNGVKPDRALYKEFMDGGYFMGGGGPKEEGADFKKLVLELSKELIVEGKTI